MTDRERIAALEAALADLRARLDPQRLKQSMEFAWEPRGGEPRIVDSDGRTLDYAPAIQFLNATAELDVPAQRVVVTPTGGAGGMAGVFSDDAVTTDAERWKFVGEAAPGTNRATFDTLSFGAARAAVLTVAEDVGTSTTTGSLTFIVVDSTGFASSTLGAAGGSAGDGSLAVGSSATQATVLATAGPGGSQGRLNLNRQPGSEISAELAADGNPGDDGTVVRVRSVSDDNTAQVQVQAIADSSAAATVQVQARYQDTGEETALVLGATTGSLSHSVGGGVTVDAAGVSALRLPATASRFLRGAFSASPGALLTGTGATVLVAGVFDVGATTAELNVFGAMQGLGAEGEVVWSWSRAGADVNIVFTNKGLGSVTPTLQFHTIGDL